LSGYGDAFLRDDRQVTAGTLGRVSECYLVLAYIEEHEELWVAIFGTDVRQSTPCGKSMLTIDYFAVARDRDRTAGRSTAPSASTSGTASHAAH
jgi:hypothetical protein